MARGRMLSRRKLLYLCTREGHVKSKTIEEVKLQLAPETKPELLPIHLFLLMLLILASNRF